MGDSKQTHLICDTPLIPPAVSVSSEERYPRQIPWRAALAAAFVKLALGILLGMYYPQGVLESSDSLEYHQLAINLAEHQVFSQSPGFPFEPETIRTPAYPALISCVYQLVGVHPQAIVPVQILLSTVTMLAGFAIASLLFNPRVGALTAVLLACDPLSLYYSQVMLTETLFGTFLTLSVLCLLCACRYPALRYPAGAGICLALATLTRPTGYYLGAVFPLMLLFVVGRARGWRHAYISAAILFILYAVPIGGWQLRNYVQTGSAEFSQAKNQYLFIAHASAIVALRDGLSLQDAQQRLAQEHAASLPRQFQPSSPVVMLESQGRFARAVMFEHPALLAWTMLKGSAANLFGPSNLAHLIGVDNVALRSAAMQGEFARFAPLHWAIACSSWIYGILFLGVLYYGVVVLLVRMGVNNYGLALLVLTATYVIVVSSGPEAYSRFRAPIMPLLCVIAAGGLISFKAPFSTRGESLQA
ncbi:MAG: glycosyltransferase family 39 protein [Nitrospira sp.]|nr:glycosyltransferase family 39 protein [Nitrospira sp.]